MELGGRNFSPTYRGLVEDDHSKKKCAKAHSEGIYWRGGASPFHPPSPPDPPTAAFLTCNSHQRSPVQSSCSTCGGCRNLLDSLRSGRNTLPDALASLSRGWGLIVQAADVAACGQYEHASDRTAPRVFLSLPHPPAPMLGRPTSSTGLRCAFIPVLCSLTSLFIQRCLSCPIFLHLATRTCRYPEAMDVVTDWWGGGGTSMT